MRRAAALALCAWLSQGCFVLEEIDKGHEIMDQHAGRSRSKPDAPAEAEEAPGVLDKLAGGAAGVAGGVREWWSERDAPEKAVRAPDDGVVECQLPAGTRFTHQSDCLAQGGRVL